MIFPLAVFLFVISEEHNYWSVLHSLNIELLTLRSQDFCFVQYTDNWYVRSRYLSYLKRGHLCFFRLYTILLVVTFIDVQLKKSLLFSVFSLS